MFSQQISSTFNNNKSRTVSVSKDLFCVDSNYKNKSNLCENNDYRGQKGSYTCEIRNQDQIYVQKNLQNESSSVSNDNMCIGQKECECSETMCHMCKNNAIKNKPLSVSRAIPSVNSSQIYIEPKSVSRVSCKNSNDPISGSLESKLGCENMSSVIPVQQSANQVSQISNTKTDIGQSSSYQNIQGQIPVTKTTEHVYKQSLTDFPQSRTYLQGTTYHSQGPFHQDNNTVRCKQGHVSKITGLETPCVTNIHSNHTSEQSVQRQSIDSNNHYNHHQTNNGHIALKDCIMEDAYRITDQQSNISKQKHMDNANHHDVTCAGAGEGQVEPLPAAYTDPVPGVSHTKAGPAMAAQDESKPNKSASISNKKEILDEKLDISQSSIQVEMDHTSKDVLQAIEFQKMLDGIQNTDSYIRHAHNIPQSSTQSNSAPKEIVSRYNSDKLTGTANP